MLHFDVALKFSIEIKAISGTLFLFSGIFVANLLFNLIQIKLANPIELLRGGKQGERAKNKNHYDYYRRGRTGRRILYRTDNGITAYSNGSVFVAVILVIIGTYALLQQEVLLY